MVMIPDVGFGKNLTRESITSSYVGTVIVPFVTIIFTSCLFLSSKYLSTGSSVIFMVAVPFDLDLKPMVNRIASSDRQARAEGARDRLRPPLRRGAGQDRGQRPARGAHRRREQAARRRVGDRHRLALRPGEHRDGGHCQRQGARHRRVSAADPDRRGHQPRQLGRAADQHARRGGRHQLADLQPLGRLHGHFVRDPDRRGGARGRATQDHRPRQPRPHRREHRPGHQGSRRVDRPGQGRRRAGAQRRGRRPGGEGRRRAGRHHHEVRRQGGREVG